MKKINMLALVVLMSVNVLTPISYAGEIPEDEVEFSDIVVENFAEGDEGGTLENENLEDENSKSYDLGDSEFLKDGVQSNVDESQVEGRESEQLLGGEEVEAVEKSEIETLVQSESEDTEFTDLSINVDEPEIGIKAEAPIIRTITHDAGKGVIKLKIGDTELRIKDKNEGAKKTLLTSEAFQLKQLMDSMCEVQHENFESLAVSAESSTKLVNYDPYSNYVCDEGFAGAATTLVGEAVNSYADAMDYLRDNYNTPTTDTYGNYYRWGNTSGYAKYEELSCQQNTAVLKADDQNSLESCDNLMIADAAESRGFMNMSDLNNAGWFEGYYDNPCDVSKGEYLPSSDDWGQLVDMWGSIKGKDTSVIKSAGFGIGDVSDFMQDLMIPNAGTIAVGSAGPEKTAKGSLGLEDEGLLYYSSQPDYLWSSKGGNYQQPGGLVLYNDGEYGEGYYGNLEYESANPVRCFVVPEDQRTTVKLVDGKEEKTIIIQKGTAIKDLEIPTKNGYTFEGWYTGDDEEWNFNTVVEDDVVTLHAKWRVCGEGFTVRNNRCVPSDIDMEGVIEVSDGNNTMYVRDRNVGAEKSFLEMVWIFDFSDYISDLQNLYNNGEITRGEMDQLLLSWVNENVGDFVDLDEFYDYMNDFQSHMESILIDTVGNYYFWGNNVGVNARTAIFDEETQTIDDSSSRLNSLELPEGFDHGYIGLEGGNDWTVGSDDTPCVGNGEYLPGPDDWKLLLQMWGNNNGYVLTYDEEHDEYGFDDSSFRNKAVKDFGLATTPAVYVSQNGSDFEYGPLYRGSYANGKIGYLTLNGLSFFHTSNLQGYENNIAMPVRCFVNVPDVLVVTLMSDGKLVKEVNVVSGDKLSKPANPTKNGYKFLGWYTSETGGEERSFEDDIVNGDINLYARREKNQDSGSNYSGGGGGSSKPTNSDANNSDNSNSNSDSNKSNELKDVEGEQGIQNDSSVDSQDQVSTQDKGGKDATKWRGSDVSRVIPDETKYDSSYSEELNAAYQFSYSNGITTQPTIKDAKTDGKLTRIQMAKMLSYYAMNVLGQEPDLSRGNVFKDVSRKLDVQYDNAVTLSYQLGIMGINMPNNEFRPFDYVPRSEFVTALSRMIYDDVPDGLNAKFYEPHMAKLYNEGIITNTNPKLLEHRGYVMLMLYRTLTSI